MLSIDLILLPTDFSSKSDEAFSLACSIARDHFAEVLVLHVSPPCEAAEPSPERMSAEKAWQERFSELKHLATDVPLHFREVEGYPVGTIVKVAAEEHCDLIVMASHDKSIACQQLHGSVTEGVLRHSACPVLCLRSSPTQDASNDAYFARLDAASRTWCSEGASKSPTTKAP